MIINEESNDESKNEQLDEMQEDKKKKKKKERIGFRDRKVSNKSHLMKDNNEIMIELKLFKNVCD